MEPDPNFDESTVRAIQRELREQARLLSLE
jgi:hypothetical protein